MGYELAKHMPSLFQKGVIRRTAKSALGQICKSKGAVRDYLNIATVC